MGVTMMDDESIAVGSCSSRITWLSPKQYEFVPKPDITAYELAHCLIVFESGKSGLDIEPLIKEYVIGRHFEER